MSAFKASIWQSIFIVHAEDILELCSLDQFLILIFHTYVIFVIIFIIIFSLLLDL